MQRPRSKTTRHANAAEKAFHAWLKEQPCCVTGMPGPSIVHHCEGSTFKHNKTLIGHWFCISLCREVDDVITHGSRRKFRELYGPQSRYWYDVAKRFEIEMKKRYAPKRPCGGGSCATEIIPWDVRYAIMDWGK